MKKKTVVLDLTGCPHVGELQPRIKKAFGFPEWYGQNWGAFWDMISRNCKISKVIVVGEDTLPPQFDKDIRILKELLEDEKREAQRTGWEFDYEIR